jgi:hypothetical protein
MAILFKKSHQPFPPEIFSAEKVLTVSQQAQKKLTADDTFLELFSKNIGGVPLFKSTSLSDKDHNYEHFLSEVTFGGFVAYASIKLFCYILFEKSCAEE